MPPRTRMARATLTLPSCATHSSSALQPPVTSLANAIQCAPNCAPTAVVTRFNLNLTPQLCQLLVRKYDRFGTNSISFDSFVQCCVTVQGLTNAFQRFDTNRVRLDPIHIAIRVQQDTDR